MIEHTTPADFATDNEFYEWQVCGVRRAACGAAQCRAVPLRFGTRARRTRAAHARRRAHRGFGRNTAREGGQRPDVAHVLLYRKVDLEEKFKTESTTDLATNLAIISY